MEIKAHKKITGFSGNDIFCLHKLNLKPGQLCIGNYVISLGIFRGFRAGLKNFAGGEIHDLTQIICKGRKSALKRMLEEAKQYGGIGLSVVSFDINYQVGGIEFLAIGSTIQKDDDKLKFSISDDAKALYCQLDAGFKPREFVFGNVVYSIGVGRNIKGYFSTFKTGEVQQYTELYNRTRHLALTRIKEEAKKSKSNAVLNIKTTIMSTLGAQEMLMFGTASNHDALSTYYNDPVTCSLTNQELWNLVNIGYLPIRLVIGVSVYSMGIIKRAGSAFKSQTGGYQENLTNLMYEAREKALSRLEEDADKCGADEVVGVKTYIYEIDNGLVEFLAIGTAVKKFDGITTKNQNLLPQAIIEEKSSFTDETIRLEDNMNSPAISSMDNSSSGIFSFLFSSIFTIIVVVAFFLYFA